MASSGLNEESVEKRLMSVTNTQDSIQSLSLWIIHHKTHHKRIVELWYKVLKRTVKPSHRLTLFYLCNDVVQTCKRKKASIFIDTFKPLVKQGSALVRDISIKPKVERIFTIWEERQVFDKDFVAELKAILGGASVSDGKPADDGVFKVPHSHRHKLKDKSREKKKERAREKAKAKEAAAAAALSPDLEEFDAVQPADPTLETEEKEKVEEVEAPSEEVLAAFKPPEMIEKIRLFKHQAAEIDIKVRQLSNLKLDASSIEAIKQLKDRAHGNEFSTQFEESCLRLEDAVRGLEKKKGEQSDLLSQLTISEFFYDQQYREARIVANAYKNYGACINTMKRKLGELLRTLPSPVPSPSHEAPSPGNTPPLQHDNYHAVAMDMDDGDHQLGAEDDDIPSPPDEAPSPVGSSPGDTPTAMKGGSSLENRLASFIPSLQSGSSGGEHPIPVYVPQPLNSNGSTSSRRPSANKTLTEPDMPFPEEEGGGTPLTDEQPSTPVMDEEQGRSPSPPPPPPPPPEKKKKENPIDFLSRLISQTQKSKPVGTSSTNSSFLESFSLLTSKVKESIDYKKSGTDDEDSSQGGSPGPKSWKAWKAEKAAEEGGMEPASIPMGIPPPPIPIFGVPPPPPPPPPPSSIAPSVVSPVGISPVMPLPVPPPDPTSPFFQHTSPGQKENWPDMNESGDNGDNLTSPDILYPPMQADLPSPPFPPIKSVVHVKSILRNSGNSVLKELTPSRGESSASGPLLAPPPPPPPLPSSVAGEGNSISTLGSGSNSEAQEFMEKLKRKTSVGGTPPAYTPNPVRPNLMTLTPGGEMDMDVDEEEEGEEEEEEEEEDERPRIPVLSSVVRRVDPVEQRQAREKEMQLLRDREREPDKHEREMHEPAAPPPRGDSFHRERRFSRENHDGYRENHDSYFPSPSTPSNSNFGFRDNRSFGFRPEQPEPYYPRFPQNSEQNFRRDGQYNNNNYFGPGPQRPPFIKQGFNRGGNRRNYHY